CLLSHLSAGEYEALTALGLQTYVRTHLDGVRRAGRLPLSGLGERAQAYLTDTVLPMAQAWIDACSKSPFPVQRQGVRFEHAGVVLEDWLDHLVADQSDGETPVQLVFSASALFTKDKKKTLRVDKLVLPWIHSLLAAASGLR